jgi:hypothetical protein
VYRSRTPGRNPSDGIHPRPAGPPAGHAAHTRRARRGGTGPETKPDTRPEKTDREARSAADDVVPIRRGHALSVAGFAALLGIGLIFGAQSAGPDNRLPFALVVFGAQALFVLAWALALRPPAVWVVAAVGALAALGANAAAVLSEIAALGPLTYAAAGGFLAAVLGQLVRRKDRQRVTESLGATMLVMLGGVAFAVLIVLSRLPRAGTQTIVVALAATAVSLALAHLIDAVLPRPRLAPQVPRGAAGVVLGAMLGSLVGAVGGAFLAGLTPAIGAAVGFAAAATAVLADLAAEYGEASRQMAGDPPTPPLAQLVQGPLGGFALAAPLAYAMSALFL